MLDERVLVAARHARHGERDRVALLLVEDRQVARLDGAQGHHPYRVAERAWTRRLAVIATLVA